MFCCQFLWRKYLFLSGQQKNLSRTSYWQSYRDRGYLISSLYHLSRLLSQAFELVCLYKGGNKPDVRNLNFALQSSVPSGSKLMPVIMCTMLLDSLENSRLKINWLHGQKVQLSIVAWSPCCIRNFKTPISVVWGIRSSNFCTKIGDRTMKQLP